MRTDLMHFLLGGVLVVAGCGAETKAPPPPAAGAGWTATEVRACEQLNVPECALVDPASGDVYVSNVETDKGEYWAEDGTAFIARLKPGGVPDVARWRESAAAQKQRSAPFKILNSPKGMCLLNGVLYVADITRVVAFPLDPADAGKVLPQLPTGKQFNDMASDGAAIYVSDTGQGKVFRADPDGVREVKGPPSANGITFFKDKMYGVSWGEHEVYELDASGKAEAKPFGVASHFKSLDGIEVLDDGTFIVSDFAGNKVCLIAPDRKTVKTLVEVESPADIGLDRERLFLYVPQFMRNRLVCFKLEKR